MTDRQVDFVAPPTVLNRRQFAGLPVAAAVGLVLTGNEAMAAPSTARTLRNQMTYPDRLAIEDLFTAYVWAYDCNDLAGFLDLFTEDAMVVGRGKSHAGKAAIGEWFRYLIAIREREGDDWLHQASQHRFDGGNGRCIVYSYATHFNSNAEKKVQGVRSVGYFVSECVKVGTSWKFRRLSIVNWDRNALPWTKPLPWDMPATAA